MFNKKSSDKRNRRREREKNSKRRSKSIIKIIQENLKGIILISVSLVIVVSLFFMREKLGKKIPIDEQTLCPLQAAVLNHKVIVIDKSEKWDEDDISRLEGLLKKIYKHIQFQERLTITAITGKSGQSTDIEALFDMCNPGDGSDTQCNGLYQNCKHIKNRYDNSFGEPLQRLARILSEPGQASYSPLFETMTQVIYDNNSEHLEIYFISDLMENSQHFQFDEIIPLADELVKELPIKTKATVIVHANFINRSRHAQVIKAAAQSVWHDYFVQQGIAFDSTVLLNTDN